MDEKQELRYFDMLYDFSRVVSKANEQSFEGLEPGKIAETLRRSAGAFLELCMSDSIAGNNKDNVSQEKSKDHKVIPNTPEQKTIVEQQEKKPIPNNFLKVDANGWGLCPVCGSKVLKVTSVTRLENFPVFCKRCRADHLVNWWNADNQRILYKRYVNDRYIRDQALKGTGLKSFQNSGLSATERAAMRI